MRLVFTFDRSCALHGVATAQIIPLGKPVAPHTLLFRCQGVPLEGVVVGAFV